MEANIPLVSVVIPCYNAELFIAETIESINNQNYPRLELIIVDDGSVDNTRDIIKSFDSEPTKYVYQSNSGVSAARNKGLSLCSGEFVVFFDADDKMGDNFLHSRASFLEGNQEFGFCCGTIETFPVGTRTLHGAAKDIPKEILYYDQLAATCPSNYMIRRAILLAHEIRFNEDLSSTADRFFLLQLNTVCKGGLINDGTLFYRITPDSMSNKLSTQLIIDNEKFLFYVRKRALMPPELRRVFLYKINYILGLGFLSSGRASHGIVYLLQSLFAHPAFFIRDSVKGVFNKFFLRK